MSCTASQDQLQPELRSSGRSRSQGWTESLITSCMWRVCWTGHACCASVPRALLPVLPLYLTQAVGMQVLAEQCRRLGLQVERVPTDPPSEPAPPGSKAQQPKQGPSPEISSIHRRQDLGCIAAWPPSMPRSGSTKPLDHIADRGCIPQSSIMWRALGWCQTNPLLGLSGFCNKCFEGQGLGPAGSDAPRAHRRRSPEAEEHV